MVTFTTNNLHILSIKRQKTQNYKNKAGNGYIKYLPEQDTSLIACLVAGSRTRGASLDHSVSCLGSGHRRDPRGSGASGHAQDGSLLGRWRTRTNPCWICCPQKTNCPCWTGSRQSGNAPYWSSIRCCFRYCILLGLPVCGQAFPNLRPGS
jgi:hypothetical protein